MSLIRDNLNGFTTQLTLDSKEETGSIVKITDVRKVGKAGPGDTPVGILISLPEEYPGNGTILVPYNQERTVIAAAAVTPGNRIKLGTAGSSGEQRYIPFVPGTDDPILDRGVALTSASGADDTFDALIK
jgi:hypothetical protein